ncbi:MAG: hypothetical protein MK202_06790 [Tenacibaculum sp.]|nr:hypothetical protein [Tenacibaculum sp.]
MKNILFIIIFLSININSQNTIKGKLITSQNFKDQFPFVLVSVDGLSEKKLLDKDGLFELRTDKEQSNYLLKFYIDNKVVKTYSYKHSWLKRKRPKSISFTETCSANNKTASQDWKNNSLKIYIYQEDELSKVDIKIQQKYNFNYVLVHKKDYTNYDCYKNYNNRALKYLVLAKELSIKHLNKNTIGKDRFSLKDKACIQ